MALNNHGALLILFSALTHMYSILGDNKCTAHLFPRNLLGMLQIIDFCQQPLFNQLYKWVHRQK